MNYRLKNEEGFNITNETRYVNTDILNHIPVDVVLASIENIPTDDEGTTIDSTDSSFVVGFSTVDSWFETDGQQELLNSIYVSTVDSLPLFDAKSNKLVTFHLDFYDSNDNIVEEETDADYTLLTVERMDDPSEECIYRVGGNSIEFKYEESALSLTGETRRIHIYRVTDPINTTTNFVEEGLNTSTYNGTHKLRPNIIPYLRGVSKNTLNLTYYGLTSLTLQWGDMTLFSNYAAFHYYGKFRVGNGFTLTLPSGVSYIGSAPTFTNGHTYQYHIFNGYIDFVDLG